MEAKNIKIDITFKNKEQLNSLIANAKQKAEELDKALNELRKFKFELEVEKSGLPLTNRHETITINEERKKHGLEPIQGGDEAITFKE